ncbi:hypothetical protein PA598K_00880 [Paenibacillus sp. 598K]|nr:hypothetical protein PA598K_00880 [Paenibacillus sp. 598K]
MIDTLPTRMSGQSCRLVKVMPGAGQPQTGGAGGAGKGRQKTG